MKFLIQVMAAAEADRDLIYFTFGEQSTLEIMKELHEIIKKNNLNVGQVYELINEYSVEIRPLKSDDIKLFGILEFLKTKFTN